jgi:hypothetical protein
MDIELLDREGADLAGGAVDAGTAILITDEHAGWDRLDALIDEWGRHSLPASDPPSNW